MGRIISGGAGASGSGSGNSSNLASALAMLSAGETVAQGDVLTQGADGLAYWEMDQSQPGASLRPFSLAVGAYFQPVAGPYNPSLAPTNGFFSWTLCVLANGNLVNVWLDVATAADTQHASISTPLGATNAALFAIGTNVSGTQYSPMSVAPL